MEKTSLPRRGKCLCLCSAVPKRASSFPSVKCLCLCSVHEVCEGGNPRTKILPPTRLLCCKWATGPPSGRQSSPYRWLQRGFEGALPHILGMEQGSVERCKGVNPGNQPQTHTHAERRRKISGNPGLKARKSEIRSS